MPRKKTKCSIPDCVKGVTTNSFSLYMGEETAYLCSKHKEFYDGFPSLENESLITVCDCRKNFRLHENDKCSTCEDKAYPINNLSLDQLIRVLRPIHSKTKKDAATINNALILFMASGLDYEEALEKMQETFIPKKMREPAVKKSRVSKKALISEAQQAAFAIATQRLVIKIQEKLPSLISILGLSEEKTVAVQKFLTSKMGEILISGLLSVAASYLPVPGGDKYEHLVAKIAEELRIHTMGLVGTSGLDLVFSLFSTEIVKDIKEQIQTFEQVVAEVPVELVSAH